MNDGPLIDSQGLGELIFQLRPLEDVKFCEQNEGTVVAMGAHEQRLVD
jgi:hypothetical protein